MQQLNKAFLDDWFDNNEGTRWRGDGMAGGGMGGGGDPGGGGHGGGGDLSGGGVTSGLAALTWQGGDPTAYEKAYEIKYTASDYPWDRLIELCDLLNSSNLADHLDELEAILDVDRALWLCAFEIVFHDDDGYVHKRGSDYYLYHDLDSDRIHLMQYDANECMNLTNNEQWTLFFREDDVLVPIMNQLMPIPQYRQRYLAHVRTILDAYFNEEYISQKLDAYRSLIAAEVKADTKKLYTNTQFDNGIQTLKTFVRTRRAYLLNYTELKRPVPQIISVEKSVVESAQGQTLTIAAHIGGDAALKNVSLYLADKPNARYSSLPMLDDGKANDSQANDGIYTITLPLYAVGTSLRYYVEATAADQAGTLAFYPARAEKDVFQHTVLPEQADYTPIVINEAMASNAKTIADPQGDYDDWIELINTSNQTVDLSGMYLSDNLENPLKWRFPQDITLETGAFQLVWADEDGKAEAGLHANFKLSAQGETVLLFDKDENGNRLLDSLSFGAQRTDYSFGHYPDNDGEKKILDPTPMTANKLATILDDIVPPPSEFHLAQNFPNPFNPSTTIRYQIAESSFVELKIYDIIGRNVATLVSGDQSAGEYSVTWETHDLASGIYLYALNAGNFHVTKRMVLLR